MSKVLVQWSANWADEMDVSGFTIMDKEEWKDLRVRLKKKKNFTVCIGSNETIEYSDGKQLIDELEVTNISPDDERVITKFFGDSGGFTDFLSVMEEDDDEDEDIEDVWGETQF